MTDNTLSDLIFEANDDLIDALEEMIDKLEDVNDGNKAITV